MDRDPDRRADRMLSREDIVAMLQSHADGLRSMGITSLSLFGSRARGNAGPDSDLDVLIETSHTFTLIELSRAQYFMEDLLHLPVQVTPKPLPPDMLRRVSPDEVSVF